jgi:23S rRNA (cytosine1962-C5)-methyltransferase
MKNVRLRRDLSRAIRQGSPWIFRDALDRPSRIPDGDLVGVEARDGRTLATGFWDARSPIAVRILSPAPVPDPGALVDARLRAALDVRLMKLNLHHTTAFRWVHGEADRLPGVHVDLYGDSAVVRFDGEGARAFYRDLGQRLHAIRPLAGAVDRQTGRSLAGRVPHDIVVLENGLRFEVSPGEGGKGGLFLDQRENRDLVGRLSSGASVLNLFGYTGGFSLYAARGGASSSDTVDVARPALSAAKRNFELNGLRLDAARFHARDAFEFLEEAVSKRRTWSLVVSDPPSFAPRKSALESARRAYTRLHRLAAAVTAPGGTLCAASCSSHFPRADFLATLEAGARLARRRFRLDDVRGPAIDHPSADFFPEGDYLKFAVGRVD